MTDHEQRLAPLSLQLLDNTTAPLLLAYLSSARNGLKIPAVNHSVLPILWVIDGSGRFRFALEEVVDITNEQFMFPLSRHLATPDGHAKLGHPALLPPDDKTARLAGELLFDPDFGQHGWVISNKSGRYGLVSGVTRPHLSAVVRRLADFGIRVDEYFLPPRR
jgi:hypothetical protein